MMNRASLTANSGLMIPNLRRRPRHNDTVVTIRMLFARSLPPTRMVRRTTTLRPHMHDRLQRSSVLCATMLAITLGHSLAADHDYRATGWRFDPVVQEIHGFTVHVDPALIEGKHSIEGARALSMLANHLERISLLVVGEQLDDMRSLEIWIEREHSSLGNMQYHPSIGWLRQHGHDERLAKKVHIPRARNLLSREQLLKHPAVVLHELAHAYHDQILGFNNERIIAVYDQAKAEGNYEKILSHKGEQVRHYGLNDHKEYFAEGTEAYFYRNDFYPFVRAELELFDPRLHDLLANVWEK